MYKYDSLWRTMKERGVTTYSLVNHYNISSHTMSNIRHNENITVETLHRLCQILHCQANNHIAFCQSAIRFRRYLFTITRT